MRLHHPLSRSSGDLLADRRHAWAQAALDAGDRCAAADLFAQIVAMVPDWPPGWFGLGEAYAGLDDAAAIAAFRRCLALEPDDRLGASLRLARLGAAGTAAMPAAAMPPAYVRTLFDDYAGRFEAHLTGALAYRGPAVLVGAIGRAADRGASASPFASTLDLGCGSGLMGEAIRPATRRLAGCDLSPAMVGKARVKGVYDHLAVAEAVAFLAAEPPGAADLVLAADMVVYLGDLAPLFAAAARSLRPGGLFAFTAQAGGTEGFTLGEDLRYAHGRGYLRRTAAAAGLEELVLDPVSTRLDRGQPVAGFVAVLRRPAGEAPGIAAAPA